VVPVFSVPSEPHLRSVRQIRIVMSTRMPLTSSRIPDSASAGVGLAEIRADVLALERETEGLLADLLVLEPRSVGDSPEELENEE